MDDGTAPNKLARIHATWLKVLERVATGAADVALILEDDLDFNHHLRHNLTAWGPLRATGDGNLPFFGSIYNPDRPPFWRPASGSYFIVKPEQMWGAQAVLVSRRTAAYFLTHWQEEQGAADLRMPRLGARLAPVYLHAPSLVQHVRDASTWGGPFHTAPDFDREWRAPFRAGRRARSRSTAQSSPSENASGLRRRRTASIFCRITSSRMRGGISPASSGYSKTAS